MFGVIGDVQQAMDEGNVQQCYDIASLAQNMGFGSTLLLDNYMFRVAGPRCTSLTGSQ
jgi:hypothetical protein